MYIHNHEDLPMHGNLPFMYMHVHVQHINRCIPISFQFVVFCFEYNDFNKYHVNHNVLSAVSIS